MPLDPVQKLNLVDSDPRWMLSYNNVPLPEDEFLWSAQNFNFQIYLRLKRDAHLMSSLTKRVQSVVGRRLIVESPAENRKGKKAIDTTNTVLKNLSYESICTELLINGLLIGFAIAQVDFENIEGIITPTLTFIPHYRWSFAYWQPQDTTVPTVNEQKLDPKSEIALVKGYELRLLTKSHPTTGERVPKDRFIAFSYGSYLPWGLGLGYQCYPWVQIKDETRKAWLLMADRLGSPPVHGTHPPQLDVSTPDSVALRSKFRSFLQSVSPNAWFMSGQGFEVKLLETQALSPDAQKELIKLCDDEVSKAILGEVPMSNRNYGSRAASESQNQDRNETLTDSDCNLFDEQMGALWRRVLELNGGGEVTVRRETEADKRKIEDDKAIIDGQLVTAQKDAVLIGQLGLKPSQEYITETYGEEWTLPVDEPAAALPDIGGDDPVEMSEPIDFAGKKGGGGKQFKDCQTGYSCGYGCIPRTKKCSSALPGQAGNYADWLVGQAKGGGKLSDIHKADAAAMGLGGSGSGAGAKVKADAKPKDGFPSDPSSLKPVRSLGGSTGAHLVEDGAGNQFVKKSGANAGQIKDEVTADNIYRAIGVAVPESRIHNTADGPVKLAKFVKGKQLSEFEDNSLGEMFGEKNERGAADAELRKHFAADALLGNWDVIGKGGDNVIVGADGKVYRVDNGGALRYRAMGGEKGKAWNGAPIELFSMRDQSVNGQSADVFAALTYREVLVQSKDLVKQRAKILKAAGDPALQKVLSDRLNAMSFLAKNFDSMAKAGLSDNDIESFHKHLVESGNPPTTQKEAKARYDEFIGKNIKAHGLSIDPKRVLSADEVSKISSTLSANVGDDPISSAYHIQQWNDKLNNPEWKAANNAPPPPPPSGTEIGAINNYTSSSYGPMNAVLRGEKTGFGKVERDLVLSTVDLTVSGMKQLPSYGGTSYRGTRLEPNHLAKYQVGKTYTDPAFGSTSTVEGKAFNGNTYFIYHAKKSNGLGKDVMKFSNVPGENEVLYPPGVKFKVVSKQTGITYKAGDKTYENVIVLQEI
jgi:hypothetical protein